MDSGLCLTELAALFLSLIGYICCLVALFIPRWLIVSSGMLVNESYQLGLWQTCAIQDVGSRVCQDFQTILDLPLQIQLGRVLMCLSVSCGVLGFMVSTPALTCLKCLDDQDKYVRKIAIMIGGGLFLLAGASSTCFVSYFAYDAFVKFWNLPKDIPRFEYGSAMFSGWTGGLFLIAGGSVLIVSHFYSGQGETSPVGSNATTINLESV
ncbi:putative claudin-24 [Xenopus laevis]|uniref:Claudin-24 n=2 Tax=Xenopus laevis TaxID=8355 RepID=A0A1L8HF37_XENLA|nr:putative claudin-24 [Xenopus laevis]OCT94686.1 hypothetical protein XELAEV_18012372mg [Xenopus laevis]